MLNHIRLYHDYFGIEPHSPRRCELTGRTSRTDIHHIEARGMGGRDMDFIENLICVCREAHIFFGDITRFKPFLKEAHDMYMNDGIPFNDREIEHPDMEEFLAQYVPQSPKKILTDPYLKLERSNVFGYLYGHLAPLSLYFLRETCGYNHITTKEQAVDELKGLLGYYDIDPETDNKKLLSAAKGPLNRLVYFVQEVYTFLIDNNMKPVPPDKNWKNNGKAN
jgi:hypothetical protein